MTGSYIQSISFMVVAGPVAFSVPEGATVILQALNSGITFAYDEADLSDAAQSRVYHLLSAGEGGIPLTLPPHTFDATSGQLWAKDKGGMGGTLLIWVISGSA